MFIMTKQTDDRMFVTLHMPPPGCAFFREYRVVLHGAGSKHNRHEAFTVERRSADDELGQPGWELAPVEEWPLVLATLAARFSPVWERTPGDTNVLPDADAEAMKDLVAKHRGAGG